MSPRNATAGRLVRQHLWAFKVAVETGLLVTGRSLLLSRQGPPIPAGGGPPSWAPGTAQLPVSVEGQGEGTCRRVGSCSPPQHRQLSPACPWHGQWCQAGLCMPRHIWTHMDMYGHTCILTCLRSPAVAPRPLGTLCSHLGCHMDLAWHWGRAGSPLAWHGAHECAEAEPPASSWCRAQLLEF